MAREKTVRIPISDLVRDKRLVVRDIHEPVVDRYVETMRGDWGTADHWPYPPITVYRFDGVMLVADGWHRIRAAEQLGSKSVPCDIRDGTIEDAMLAAASANGKHGHPLTRDERKIAVRMALIANQGRTADRAIAKMVGCSPTTVGIIRTELVDMGLIDDPFDRIGADGKAYSLPTRARTKKEPEEKTPAWMRGWEEKTAEVLGAAIGDDHRDEAPQVSNLDTCSPPVSSPPPTKTSATDTPEARERRRFRDMFLRSRFRREVLAALVREMTPGEMAFVAAEIGSRMATTSDEDVRMLQVAATKPLHRHCDTQME